MNVYDIVFAGHTATGEIIPFEGALFFRNRRRSSVLWSNGIPLLQ